MGRGSLLLTLFVIVESPKAIFWTGTCAFVIPDPVEAKSVAILAVFPVMSMMMFDPVSGI
jgi:hypothetical protein